MKIIVKQLVFLGMTLVVQSLAAYQAPVPPFAPAAGNQGSTAIAYTDPSILSWATGVTDVTFGEEVSGDGGWMDPQSAIGPSSGGGSGILVLGRGGSITLEFRARIADRDGNDFVVFENAFSDTFLELAYVEISSDGLHFVRFPNYSYTLDPVGTWGHVQATLVHGLAGKYRAGFGTPFDLADLKSAYEAVQGGYDKFSDAFRNQLVNNFPHVDLNAVRYVRLADVVGDGNYLDCEGFAIYDPYPTRITAGFDLDAVGVMHPGMPATVAYTDWVAQHGLSGHPGDDFDSDGWPDVLEYHFRTDPAESKKKPGFEVLPSSAGSGYDLVYRVSGIVQGGVDLYYSADGSAWQLLDPAPDNPDMPETMDWIEGEPFINRTQKMPSENGNGFFRWIAVP